MQNVLSALQFIAKYPGNLLFHLLVMLPLVWITVLTRGDAPSNVRSGQHRLQQVTLLLLGLRVVSAVVMVLSNWFRMDYNFTFFLLDRAVILASVFLLGCSLVLNGDTNQLKRSLFFGFLGLGILIVITVIFRPQLSDVQPFYAGTYLEWLWSGVQLLVLLVWIGLVWRWRPVVWQTSLGLFIVLLLTTGLHLGQALFFAVPIGGEVAVLVRIGEIITYSLFLLAVIARYSASVEIPKPAPVPDSIAIDWDDLNQALQQPEPEPALLQLATERLLTHAKLQALLFCAIPTQANLNGQLKYTDRGLPASTDLPELPRLQVAGQLQKPVALDNKYQADIQLLSKVAGSTTLRYWFWVPCGDPNRDTRLAVLAGSTKPLTTAQRKDVLAIGQQISGIWQVIQPPPVQPPPTDITQLQLSLQQIQQAKAALHLQVQNLQSQLHKNSTQLEKQAIDGSAQLEQLRLENQRLTKQLENSTIELDLQTKSLSHAQEQLRLFAGVPADWRQQIKQQAERVANQQERLTSFQEQLELSEAERERLKKEVVQLAKELQQNAFSDPVSAFRSQADGGWAALQALGVAVQQPLRSIANYVGILLNETVGIIGAGQRDFLERIQLNLTQVNNLLQQATDRSGRDMGTLLRQQPVDVTQLVDTVLLDIRQQFKDKGIALRLDLADELPSIQVDPDALRQILQRLLQNAYLASPAKSQVVLYMDVTTYGQPLRPHLQITVRDAGTGIAPIDYRRVFLTYRSASAPIAGLGEPNVSLAMVKALVEAHFGEIWIDSQVGKGSEFNVMLPVSAPAVQSRGGA